MRYWPSVRSRRLDFGLVFFCVFFFFLDEVEVHIDRKKRTRLISSHFDWKARLRRDLISNKMIIALLRNHTCLFRETRKKANCFCNNPALIVFLCFDCLLPLFVTLSLTLSKKYELCMSAPSFFFPLMLPSVFKAGNREQARWAHLSRSDSQSEHKIHPRARG